MSTFNFNINKLFFCILLRLVCGFRPQIVGTIIVCINIVLYIGLFLYRLYVTDQIMFSPKVKLIIFGSKLLKIIFFFCRL